MSNRHIKHYAERCELISRVSEAVYNSTDSFEGEVGMQLAYLLWEIADPSQGVDWVALGSSEVYTLFSGLFDKDDEVWNYIRLPSMRHFVVVGHVPDGPTISAHIEAPSPTLAVRKFTETELHDSKLPENWWLEDSNSDGDPWCLIDAMFEVSEKPIKKYEDCDL